MPARKPLTRLTLTSPPQGVTDIMLEAFKNDPTTLVGKQFLRHEGSEDEFYEVAEVVFLKGNGRVFRVQFEGCIDLVDIDSEEEMLGNV